MYLLFSNAPFTYQLTQALCWTFIHSLWQGLVLALAAASLIQLTKRAGSLLRYRLLSAIFLLFIITALVTFYREFKSPDRTNTSGFAIKAPVSRQTGVFVSHSIAGNTNNQNQLSVIEKCTNYLNANAVVIVLLWFVLFCAKSLQMLLNIGYIQRLRFYKTQIPPANWKDKIKELSRQIGIKRMVVILESGIVKVPVVVGFLKPVLLMPLGLLANLPADEIEAILLHELAHIQRKDYFINLVQCFIEVVFFFNPALLWISSLIKEERENCCDDIAITATNNKAKFIQALISFQEYNAAVPVYSMAFGNGKSHLLNRVKRIILNKNKTLNTMEKTLFAGSLAAVVLFTFSPVKKIFSFPATQYQVKETGLFHKANSTASGPNLEVVSINQSSAIISPIEIGISNNDNTIRAMDTIPTPAISQPTEAKPGGSQNEITNFFSSINHKGSTTIIWMEATGIDGKKYKIKKVNNTITALYVDGVKIADEHINDYRELISKIEIAGSDHLKEAAKENEMSNEVTQQKERKMYAEDAENQIANIDYNKINQEIKEALAKVDFQKIKIETEMAIKNIDLDKIKISVDKAIKEAQIQIKNIDIEKIKKQIEQSQQKIKNENLNLKIDKEKINKQVDEALSIARKQIENAKILNSKIDKQVEEALRMDRQQIEQQREPE